jgi:hypothetical protein
MNDEDLRYPVGRPPKLDVVTSADLNSSLAELETAPKRLEDVVSGLKAEQLDTTYRPGGWTVRQVVHHLADSHMNSYCRFRMALTEETPAILAYQEGAWAELSDAKGGPIEPSLAILRGVHERWTALLRSLQDEEWKRSFWHPERGASRLDHSTVLYAWHCRHHISHIERLRERQGW